MTIRECAIIEAYTGICMCAGERRGEFYKYVAEIMGRPVYTHEFADKKIQDEITEKSKPDFVKLCQGAVVETPFYYVQQAERFWYLYKNPDGKTEDADKHELITHFYTEDMAKETADKLNARRVLQAEN